MTPASLLHVFRFVSLFLFVLGFVMYGECPAADWAVPPLLYRMPVKVKSAPSEPANGYLIRLPQFGQVRPDGRDIILLDGANPVPIRVVYQKPGVHVLILAKDPKPGRTCTLYFGGDSSKIQVPTWEPQKSLFLETRPLQENLGNATWSKLETVWSKTTASFGGDFVNAISERGNPFGPHYGYLSRYSGRLAIPDLKEIEVYGWGLDTAGFQLDGKTPLFQPVPANVGLLSHPENIAKKRIDLSMGPVNIEAFHAKEPQGGPIGMEGMVDFGWIDPGIAAEAARIQKENEKAGQDGEKNHVPSPFKPLPPKWYEHPGETETGAIETNSGAPVPLPVVTSKTYIGWNDLWFVEVSAKLARPLPEGWTAKWEFAAGGTAAGDNVRQILAGIEPAQVKVTLTNGAASLSGFAVPNFYAQIPAASVNKPADTTRYCDLLGSTDPESIHPESLGAFCVFLAEFGPADILSKYVSAWMASGSNRNSPLWEKVLPAYVSALAQTSPKEALAVLKKARADFRSAEMQEKLAILETDILVFILQDPSVPEQCRALSLLLKGKSGEKLGIIRMGDFYRLTKQPDKAITSYLSARRPEAQTKKQAAIDQSTSMKIKNLIDAGEARDAMDELVVWELQNPMAKLETDFLLLRSRALIELGRYAEAVRELQSFAELNADSPYQIDADFYLASALKGAGRTREAEDLWKKIVEKYPRSPLASEAKRLLGE